MWSQLVSGEGRIVGGGEILLEIIASTSDELGAADRDPAIYWAASSSPHLEPI